MEHEASLACWKVVHYEPDVQCVNTLVFVVVRFFFFFFSGVVVAPYVFMAAKDKAH